MRQTTVLEQYPFYLHASPDFKKEIENLAVTVRLAAGDYFFHDGDICAHFALLGTGRLRVFKTSQSGREITLYHVAPGETCLVSLLSAILQQGSPASAAAETAVEAVALPAARLRHWLGKNNDLRLFVFQTLASRLIDVMTLVEEVAFARMDRRLAEYLLQQFQGKTPTAALDTTHEQIAFELGTAREVVSRLLRELDRAGAVRTRRGSVQLHDAGLLRRLADRD